ncbi:MAG TPA: YfhO family protein, partial [Chloroflexota bacterium]|nr:YfhO family protein [Chloroflexota bacterium]
PRPSFDFPETPPIAWLREQMRDSLDERVTALGSGVLIPNTNIAHRLRSAALQDPVQSCRYQTLLDALNRPDGTPHCTGQHRTSLERLDARALHVLGVGYAFARREAASGMVPPPGVHLAYADKWVEIYRPEQPARRAYVAGEAVVFPSGASEVLTALRSPKTDLSNTVLLEVNESGTREFPSTWPTAPACATTDRRISQARASAHSIAPPAIPPAGRVDPALNPPLAWARIVFDAGSETRIQAFAPSGGFLVLSDSYYPGWQAYVDGERVPLCRANFLFRAVPLSPGAHEVTFRYAPLSFSIGLTLTCLALLASGILLTWGIGTGTRLQSARRGFAGIISRLMPSDGVTAIGWSILLGLSVMVLGFAPLPRLGG